MTRTLCRALAASVQTNEKTKRIIIVTIHTVITWSLIAFGCRRRWHAQVRNLRKKKTVNLFSHQPYVRSHWWPADLYFFFFDKKKINTNNFVFRYLFCVTRGIKIKTIQFEYFLFYFHFDGARTAKQFELRDSIGRFFHTTCSPFTAQNSSDSIADFLRTYMHPRAPQPQRPRCNTDCRRKERERERNSQRR